MARKSNISRADNLYSGRPYAPGNNGSIAGILRSHLVLVRWGAGSPQGWAAPTLAVTTAIAAAQAVAAAGNLTINGTLASGGIATNDVPRSLQMVSTNAGDTTQTVTAYGTDTLGRLVMETRTLNGTTIVNFQKAFKTVTRVAVSAALTGNISVGNNAVLGLPVRIRTGDVVMLRESQAAAEIGTIVAGDLTTPSATTGDPCGTLTTTTALNGTRIFTALVHVESADENAFGSQFYA
jgi:hypothetical protein